MFSILRTSAIGILIFGVMLLTFGLAPASKRVNTTSGWGGIGLYKYDDGDWLMERYEPTYDWRSFELFSVGYVSSHYLRIAEGVCFKAEKIAVDASGALTNQIFERDRKCLEFNKLWNVTRRLNEKEKERN
jgi:hypothetical protein